MQDTSNHPKSAPIPRAAEPEPRAHKARTFNERTRCPPACAARRAARHSVTRFKETDRCRK